MKKQPWVFVDVDGTLIDHLDNPRPNIPQFLSKLKKLGVRICVWSAGGAEYAESKFNGICNRIRLDLRHLIDAYFWKAEYDKIVSSAPRFFIDDVQPMLDAKRSEGHGVFKVPFYNDPSVVSSAELEDKWLLRAADAVERWIKEKEKQENEET